MSEVTMLSKMIAAGLVLKFETNGSIARDPMLTVRIGGRTREHVYVVPHELGSSALITRAWRDWEGYCTDREIGEPRRWATNQADE